MAPTSVTIGNNGEFRFSAAHSGLHGGEMEPLHRHTYLATLTAGAAPVIATSAGGLAETVAEGRTGYTAWPGDPASLAAAVQRALAVPPGEHHRLLQAGRRMLTEQYDYMANISRPSCPLPRRGRWPLQPRTSRLACCIPIQPRAGKAGNQ